MPYQSDKQRRFMHARHPGIASRWDQEIRDQRKKKGRAVSKSVRYGNGGGIGRRITEDELVEKADVRREKASFGRHLTAQFVPGVHGAVAGRKGRKLAATGNELTGFGAGYVPASMLARVARSTRNPVVSGAAGLASMTTVPTGVALSVNRAQRKGHYVSQRRVKKSGVDKKWSTDSRLMQRVNTIMASRMRSGSLGSGIPNQGMPARIGRPAGPGRHRSARTDATPAYAAQLRRNARQGSIGQGEYVGRRRKGGIVKADVGKAFLRQSVARPIARRAATATLAQRGITQGRLVATGGAGARKGNLGVAKAEVGKGRRWAPPAGASTIVKPLRKKTRAEIGKARYFDPDERRARRSGLAIGSLGILGAASLAHGGRGALKATRATRNIQSVGLKNVKYRPGASKTERGLTDIAARKRALRAATEGINARPRDLAYIGGGTTGVLGAAELHRRGGVRRGGRWT